MSISCVLLADLSHCVLLNKMKLRVVAHKINVIIIKTIAITIQTFNEQNALSFFITQFCTGEQEFSKHAFPSTIANSFLLRFRTVMVTFDEL